MSSLASSISSPMHYRDLADQKRRQQEIKCFTEKKKQLNKDYEDALIERHIREQAGLPPQQAVPDNTQEVGASQVEKMSALRTAFQDFFDTQDDLDRFMSSLSPDYATLLTQNLKDIQGRVKQLLDKQEINTVTYHFFKSFLDDYFKNKSLKNAGLPIDTQSYFSRTGKSTTTGTETGTNTDTTTGTDTGTQTENVIILPRDEMMAKVRKIYVEKYGQDGTDTNLQMIRFWKEKGAADDVKVLTDKQLRKILEWEAADGGGGQEQETVTRGVGVGRLRFRKIGRGIAENESPRLVEFGKYAIHIPFLKKGLLTIRHKCSSNVACIPRTNISKEFAAFLLDLVDNKKVNQRLYNVLNKTEKVLFHDLVKKCNMDETLGLGLNNDIEDLDSEYNRFLVLQGEIASGNNSVEVLREFRAMILKYMKTGELSRLQGLDLLSEIAVLV